MDPITLGIGAALQAAPSIYSLITGIKQARQGKKTLAGLQRPEYNIPSDIKSLLTIAQSNYADQRFPGQNAAEQSIGANTANAIQMARDSGNPMNAISAIQGNANKAALEIGAEAARQQRADYQDLANIGNIMAQYKDQAWQLNKFAPYSEKYNEGREQIGAGQTNISNALSGLGTIGSTLAMAGIGGKKPGGGLSTPTPGLTNLGAGAMYGALGTASGQGLAAGSSGYLNAGNGAMQNTPITLSQLGINAGQLAQAAGQSAAQSGQIQNSISSYLNGYNPWGVFSQRKW